MHKFQVSGLTKENVIGWGIKGISVTVIFNDLFFKICKLRKIKFEDWRKLDNEVKNKVENTILQALQSTYTHTIVGQERNTIKHKTSIFYRLLQCSFLSVRKSNHYWTEFAYIFK